ncbi:Endochitinase 1 [Puccinia graminis f. sp. tritici]|uniref:chitinase n=1 Tax=Puccinia graminis f. sp. tritici TaxID=56615 RepID=A0A5B0NAB8_PUCGR|nr:Endochitinase 1 [Puccinia graminis f. sp. tritici]KAA1095139.1 Endochitinase 1 [Puccinia graminis f. sp. tritici]KAA1121410.1 Endochitinase 1 [Puccinia graminis f. sp. tritici]
MRSKPAGVTRMSSIPTPIVESRRPRSKLRLHPLIGYAVISAFILLANLDFFPITTHALSTSSYYRAHKPKAAAKHIMHSHYSGSEPEPAEPPTADSDSSYNDTDSQETYKNGAVSATYFVNWAIYGRHHFPWEVPVESVTHVFYAFANVRPESGEVYLTDSWADEQIHWADRGDSWNDSGNNLYGCFNQFRQLKQKNRHLKLIISIGGWSYSANFAPATSSPEKRQKFVDSAIAIVENYGLDGLDLDWEYPTNDKEADQLVDVLRRARSGLNKLKQKKNDQSPYVLTIAAPCGPNHYKQLHLKEMTRYLSFINLMAYDYAGSWDTLSGHQANLHLTNSSAVNQGNFSTAAAVEYYMSQSVPASSLVVGMPLYGRSFLNTKGIGQAYNGLGQGNWEPGIYDYKTIPMDNAKLVEDMKAVGAYTYNPSNQELITFDTPNTVRRKVKYIEKHGLGGVMWWESSGDKQNSDGALIPLAAKLLGKLDSTPNHLSYPGSKWDNLKSNHPPSNSSVTPSGGYRAHNQHRAHKTHHKHSVHHHKVKQYHPVQGSY